MKLDLLQLDVTEAAAAVAHAAASQLYGMMNDTDGWDWAGTGLEGDDLAARIYEMAGYTLRHRAHGEQLWLKMRLDGKLKDDVPESDLFADLEKSRQWAFVLFSGLCQSSAKLFGVEQHLQKMREEEKGRKAPPLPELEDTIFEKVGSMGEMDPDRMRFLRDLARRPAPRQPEPAREVTPTQTINIGVPNAQEPADQQPKENDAPGAPAGATQEGAAVVPGDGGAAAETGKGGQPAGADGAAGRADDGAGETAAGEAGGANAGPADGSSPRAGDAGAAGQQGGDAGKGSAPEPAKSAATTRKRTVKKTAGSAKTPRKRKATTKAPRN